MATDAVVVRGLRELSVAFSKAGRDTSVAFRKELRGVAEPIRSQASALARHSIPNIGPRWGEMRTGVTRKLVYVAPKQRGVKTRGRDRRKRPNLATLLAERATQPALEHNKGQINQRVERMLDKVARDFNNGV